MTKKANARLTWEHRLALWLPRPLLLGALIIAVCLSAAYLSFQWFFDFRLKPPAFGAVVFVAISLMAPRYFLAPSAHFSEKPPSDHRKTEVKALQVCSDRILRSRLAGAAGVLLMAGLWVLLLAAEGSDPAAHWIQIHDNSAHTALLLWLGWIAGRFAYYEYAGFYRPLGPKKSDIDLLNLERVYAFSTRGLHGSLPWFVILAVAYVLILPGLGKGLWIMLSITAINLWWAFVFLLAPAREVGRLIRDVKREELGRLEPLLRKARDDVLAGDQSVQGRLTDLLAYKNQIETTPEWRFDFPTLLRLGIYVLLPFATMVGGALVEHVLDLVID